MTANFIGEHLLPGQLGHFFSILSFVASMLATVAYYLAGKEKADKEARPFLLLGRFSYGAMVVGVMGVVTCLFFIIYQHYFEYHYAWRHSSKALPVYYMISCFWEGQEGSFLLWMFWQAVLGMILMTTAKKWEAPVLSVISFSQVFLSSMLLGIWVFGYRVGSNPFELVRNVMENAPIFKQPDYLKFVQDGNGLNPLLQNYWMVIHPPILFLGFSSTVVPFAFAIAGWWKKDFDGWTKPAWAWSLFSGAVLTTGIMMGAAWAYEALTFGGYWAWDPVENASLMPWITLIAGIHTLLAYRHSGHALKATFLFFFATFCLVLYASFLTRSGILGETSVHAFTDLGLGGQLVFYLGTFVILGLLLFFVNGSKVTSPAKEESTYSREFWLFIGALVLLISIIQITFTTSIPVFNKLFGTNWAPPADAKMHYNRIQIWIGILLALLSACVQYFRYKQSDIKIFLQRLILPVAVSLLIAAALVWHFRLEKFAYWLLVWCGSFTIVANLQYVLLVLKGKIKVAGGSVAHIGFGLAMVGILLSSDQQKTISNNAAGVDFGDGFTGKEKNENILLYKNVTMKMDDYEVTYLGDSTVAPNTYYKVHYVKRDESGKIKEEFYLYPNAQVNEKMGGLISSPDTRHYFSHDVYTHVTSVPNHSDEDKSVDEKDFTYHKFSKGDTVRLKSSFVVLENISPEPLRSDIPLQAGDLVVSARFKVHTDNTSFDAEPLYIIRNQMTFPVAAEVKELGVKIFVSEVLPKEKQLEVGISEKTPMPDYIIMKAMVFPQINLLWLGVVITVFGFVLSLLHRRKLKA